jgi:flagella basal body P-ring formation protein FlgA
VLVPRGGLVTLVLVTPAMSLTARGRALEAGGLGDTVRIANVDSQAVIAGVVTAAGEVTVTGSADRATDRRSGRR